MSLRHILTNSPEPAAPSPAPLNLNPNNDASKEKTLLTIDLLALTIETFVLVMTDVSRLFLNALGEEQIIYQRKHKCSHEKEIQKCTAKKYRNTPGRNTEIQWSLGDHVLGFPEEAPGPTAPHIGGQVPGYLRSIISIIEVKNKYLKSKKIVEC